MKPNDENPQPVLISVVAPVFNESSVLDAFVLEVREALRTLPEKVRSEIVLVNDGSTDGSTQKLDALAQEPAGDIKVIHLCRNFGHAAAISAGLDAARGDAVILMDADLQDDPQAFQGFFRNWRQGYFVVYAVRSSRQESLPVRWAIGAFYRLLGYISDAQIPRDAGTFSLMDRRVVQILRSMPERNRFLPGLRAWAGFRQTGVPVARRCRHDHKSRVGLRGLWRLSMNAVFSFSYFPMFLFRALGCLSLLGCAGVILFVLYHKLVTGRAVTAWASEMISIQFFGGINLLGIGVIGEYVARIYDELKGRPPYLVERVSPAEEPRDS
jgi:dolichol-phosphate mannosyltransferase